MPVPLSRDSPVQAGLLFWPKMSDGFIKLHRRLIDWEWFKSPETYLLFTYLLLSANYKKSKWRGIEIQKGQIVTGRRQLSEKTGLSEQKIRTCLQRLISTKELTIKTTNRFSIVTICNYNKYQNENNEINQNSNQQSTSNQPTTNHVQEVKEVKEVKECKNKTLAQNNFEREIEVLYSAYPRHVGRGQAIRAIRAALKKEPFDTIMAGIKRYSLEREGQDQKFTAHPATWFNGERWADDNQKNTLKTQKQIYTRYDPTKPAVMPIDQGEVYETK